MKETKSLGTDQPSCKTTAPSKSSSPSTMATTRSSPDVANDFFNSLLSALASHALIEYRREFCGQRHPDLARVLTGNSRP